MKPTSFRKTLITAALIGATALGAATAAEPQQGGYGPGYGMGPGMMGGMMGPGMMGGYGPGYGMGPGMMGGMMGPGMMGGSGYGPGMGPGMMGGMMGPGMMGGSGYGPGMGPGMMGGGGYGMGPGMMGGMGYGMLYQLNLTAEQWNKVNEIQQDQAKKNWDLAGKTQEEAIKLRKLMSAEKRDRSAITSQYKKLQEMQLQSFQATIDTQDKIEGVLTKEQKAQFHCFAPS